jgi:hypothetical protein
VQRSCLGCLAVLVFLVLAGGGGYYGLRWWIKQEKAADPTNAKYAEVGDCLVKSPSPNSPTIWQAALQHNGNHAIPNSPAVSSDHRGPLHRVGTCPRAAPTVPWNIGQPAGGITPMG